MAKRLGSLSPRTWLLGAGLAVIVAALAYLLLVRDSTAVPRLVSSRPVATIGSGSSAVAVAEDGTVLAWFPVSEEIALPELPLSEPPKGPRLAGPALEQVRILAAAPGPLRPYVESSRYGESGVDVELSTGIELRFGDASQASRKWRAAAALLADPSLTAVDYIDVHAPARAATYGSGHALPPPP
ncbi:MAG TPA: cell division protein FtsQ/DivIB [Solirubrobacterales bacterium]